MESLWQEKNTRCCDFVMSMSFELEIDSKARQEIEGSIDDFLRDIAIDLSNELKLEAPVDRGSLRQSIQVMPQEKGRYVVAVKSPHALPIQMGTKPFTPPFEPLASWGERTLNSRSIGAAVWQKIRQEGIDENPYVTRALNNLESKYT